MGPTPGARDGPKQDTGQVGRRRCVGVCEAGGLGRVSGRRGRPASQPAELIHHCHKLVEYISLGRYGPGKMVPHSSFS